MSLGYFVEQGFINSNWWGQFNGIPIISGVPAVASASQEQPESVHLERHGNCRT